MKVLHVGAELFPWVKVGGLGDVMGALPLAQQRQGVDARVLLPAYPALLALAGGFVPVARLPGLMGGGDATVLHGTLPSGVPAYLLETPLFSRPGDPYADHGDAHRRFAALSWTAAHLGRLGDATGWRPDVVHCHDWQAGLCPVYLVMNPGPSVPTVMTIHNLAYQGTFPPSVLGEVWLPQDVFQMEGVEFHGQLCFLKAGLNYAWRLTTVSPTYAREILTPEGGHGLEGVLARRERDLSGILNGIDTTVWDPQTDPHLTHRFSAAALAPRAAGKAALQSELGLQPLPDALLFAVVSRLAHAKGIDLLLPNAAHLLGLGAQLAVLGTGDPALEAALHDLAWRHPGRIAFRAAHDEPLAHRLFAGADVVVVPSRHEPCGLVQLHAQRYGALPLVRHTGGLADTVVPWSHGADVATGFAFGTLDPWHLGEVLGEAHRAFTQDREAWVAAQQRAMALDRSWAAPAAAHVALYRQICAEEA